MKSDSNARVFINSLIEVLNGLKERHNWKAWNCSEEHVNQAKDGYSAAIFDVISSLVKIRDGGKDK